MKNENKTENIIDQHQRIKLNKEDSLRIFESLSKPIKFNTKLKKAFEVHDRNEEQNEN